MSVPVVAEIGINHNGSPEIAIELVRVAAKAGCAAVKFQKRTPRVCVPPDQWDVPKHTPWGETIPYIEYRERMELDDDVWAEIARVAGDEGLGMFFSVWDKGALAWAMEFAAEGDPIKIPSAMCTNASLIRAACLTGHPVWVSTGMTEWQDVRMAAALLRDLAAEGSMLFHCHSAYPAPRDELNLYMIETLQQFGFPVGYSAHQIGIAASVWAVVLGAEVVETHITLSRSMPGSDHQSSLEPLELERLVSHVDSALRAMGDGEKVVWDSELPAREKLRWAAQED